LAQCYRLDRDLTRLCPAICITSEPRHASRRKSPGTRTIRHLSVDEKRSDEEFERGRDDDEVEDDRAGGGPTAAGAHDTTLNLTPTVSATPRVTFFIPKPSNALPDPPKTPTEAVKPALIEKGARDYFFTPDVVAKLACRRCFGDRGR
jgi:hypothetical protein